MKGVYSCHLAQFSPIQRFLRKGAIELEGAALSIAVDTLASLRNTVLALLA